MALEQTHLNRLELRSMKYHPKVWCIVQTVQPDGKVMNALVKKDKQVSGCVRFVVKRLK
jgi:hypothetical protein